MKVLFVDIDGVVNCAEDFGGRSKPNPTIGGLMGIAGARVRKLKKIVEATGAKIVLTSSWKQHYVQYITTKDDMYGKYLRNKLRKFGLDIFDTTLAYETKGSWYRGTGIYNWLAAHSVENWLVLDDESFCDYDEIIKKHFIKTSYYTGLTDELVVKAIEMLKEET